MLLDKLGTVTVRIASYRVHAGWDVEGRLDLIIFGHVVTLVVKECFKILILQLFVVRTLAKCRVCHLRTLLKTCQIATKAIEALLIEETLRKDIARASATAIVLELLCVQV